MIYRSRYEPGARLFSIFGRGYQRIRTNPLCVGMLRREHSDQIELLTTGVDECVRHSSRHPCNVRRLDGEGLVTDPVLSAALEQDVCFFGVVNMQAGPTSGMGFGNKD